jgi:hypothetical protein
MMKPPPSGEVPNFTPPDCAAPSPVAAPAIASPANSERRGKRRGSVCEGVRDHMGLPLTVQGVSSASNTMPSGQTIKQISGATHSTASWKIGFDRLT